MELRQGRWAILGGYVEPKADGAVRRRGLPSRGAAWSWRATRLATSASFWGDDDLGVDCEVEPPTTGLRAGSSRSASLLHWVGSLEVLRGVVGNGHLRHPEGVLLELCCPPHDQVGACGCGSQRQMVSGPLTLCIGSRWGLVPRNSRDSEGASRCLVNLPGSGSLGRRESRLPVADEVDRMEH